MQDVPTQLLAPFNSCLTNEMPYTVAGLARDNELKPILTRKLVGIRGDLNGVAILQSTA